MPDSTLSLMARTALDQNRAEALLKRGLEGADDGELFLEYRQAEALVFDNGRLKQATYDTAQGFGLRAVKGEAVGYAHAPNGRHNERTAFQLLPCMLAWMRPRLAPYSPP